jgi:hypothetical protein
MKTAEDGRRYNAAHVLDGAMDRRVLVERPMSPQFIILGGILRQNPAQMRFALGLDAPQHSNERGAQTRN